MRLAKKIESQEEAENTATPEAAPQTTEELLQSAQAEKERLGIRREELAARIAANNGKREQLAARIVAGEGQALAESRKLSAEAEDIGIELAALDVVLKANADHIAELVPVFRQEMELQRHADATAQVGAVVADVSSALNAYGAAAVAMRDAAAVINAGLRALRVQPDVSPYVAKAVAAQYPYPELERQRLAALERLTPEGAGQVINSMWLLSTIRGIF